MFYIKRQQIFESFKNMLLAICANCYFQNNNNSNFYFTSSPTLPPYIKEDYKNLGKFPKMDKSAAKRAKIASKVEAKYLGMENPKTATLESVEARKRQNARDVIKKELGIDIFKVKKLKNSKLLKNQSFVKAAGFSLNSAFIEYLIEASDISMETGKPLSKVTMKDAVQRDEMLEDANIDLLDRKKREQQADEIMRKISAKNLGIKTETPDWGEIFEVIEKRDREIEKMVAREGLDVRV